LLLKESRSNADSTETGRLYRKYDFFQRFFYAKEFSLHFEPFANNLYLRSKDPAINWDKFLNGLVSSKQKLLERRTQPQKCAAKGYKCFLLWAAPTLLALIPACLLLSLGQNLLTTGRNSISENAIRRSIFDNHGFGPIARSSRLSDMPFFPGAHIIYSESAMPAPIVMPNSEWWTSGNEYSAVENDPMPSVPAQAFSDKPVSQNLHPELQTRTSTPHVLFRESVSAGIGDLYAFLHEKDLKRQVEKEQSASKTNPFEEALKVARENATGKTQDAKDSATAAQASNKEATESKTVSNDAARENKTSDSATNSGEDAGKTQSASLSAGTGVFLFIGAFNDQPVATDIGIARVNQLSDLAGNGISFDLAGSGKRIFDASVILRNGAGQESVAFGDLNLDGFADMVVTDRKTSRALIYLNDKNGNYTPTAEINGNGPAAAVIGDFNQDGSSDIAVLFQTDKEIVVKGKGYRQFILPYTEIDDGYISMIPYDFGADGLKDLLLANYGSLTATLFTNLGNGTFAAADSFALQAFPMIQSSVDFDGDGISDTVYAQYLGDRVSIVIQDGRTGGFQCIGNMTLDPSLYYIVGDFNQDGVVDIAIARPK
jgi:hypothetical protein